MKIVINGKTYLAGSRFLVIDTDAHLFPMGTIATYTGGFEDTINCYIFSGLDRNGDQIDQLLRLEQVEPLPRQDDPLRVALLGQRIPHPLNQHFKACNTIGDLLNSKAPRAYVRQCIGQTAITLMERSALLALVDTMEIEQ